jgi:ABC-type phosphate transport system substrate-binding protein
MLRSVFLTGLSLALAGGMSASANEPRGPFKVIVNTRVAGRVIPREVLAQLYLGSVARWGNARLIAPVDLSSTSSVRAAFSGQVLGMPVEAVKLHWLRKLAAGQRPPLSKSSDEDVIAFVAAEPGGIGYVSHTASLPATVRELAFQ